jgi:tetratricopeptide (TPR) repeat protein
VTSRDRLPGLAAAGARPVLLDLLDRAEAAELLAYRLGRHRLTAEPRAGDTVVARCAGLPLALAIVAARAAVHPNMPLSALADQLGQGLDGLEAGDTSTSVRAVFSWSYRRLDEPAARLFRLLGLHPGPDLTTGAAASLAGRPVPRTRRLLAELTRTDLISEHRPGRYALHDLLRAYAAELATVHDPDADRDTAIQRVLDHYVHTAHEADRLLYPHGEALPLAEPSPGVTPERFGTPEQALAWFSAEHDVLLTAVGWAAGAGFDRHACRLAGALFVVLHRRGRWHDRATVQEIALQSAQRLGERIEQIRAHRYLAGAYTDLGHFRDAHDHIERALELSVAAGDLAAQARIHYERNLLYGLQGRSADALDAARTSLGLFETVGDDAGRASALTDVGWHHSRLGDHEQAVRSCAVPSPPTRGSATGPTRRTRWRVWAEPTNNSATSRKPSHATAAPSNCSGASATGTARRAPTPTSPPPIGPQATRTPNAKHGGTPRTSSTPSTRTSPTSSTAS